MDHGGRGQDPNPGLVDQLRSFHGDTSNSGQTEENTDTAANIFERRKAS